MKKYITEIYDRTYIYDRTEIYDRTSWMGRIKCENDYHQKNLKIQYNPYKTKKNEIQAYQREINQTTSIV